MKVGDLVKIKGGANNSRLGLLAVIISEGETIWDGTPIHNVRVVEPVQTSAPMTRILDRYLEQNLELISESR